MPPPSRWIILAVCVLAFVQVHVHRLAFSPLIPAFVADLGITYAEAGAIQTAYFWTYTAMQVPVGLLTDRWGARRVMLLFLAALAAGGLLFAASHTYGASVAARALVGLGAAAVWVPGMRLIAEWFPPVERGRVTGLFSAGGGAGGTLALILVPWLAGQWGWRAAYASTVIPVGAVLVLILSFVRPGPALAPGPPWIDVGESSGRSPRHPPAGFREPNPSRAPGRGALGRVLATPAIWPVNVSVLFSYGGYFSVLTFLPAFFVRQRGFSPTEAGMVTALVTAGTVVSWPLAGYVSDRSGHPKAVYLMSQVANVLACVTFATIAPQASIAGACVLAAATGLVVGGMVTPYVMVMEMFPRDLAGTATGVINAACFAGAMVLPVVLGRVVDLTGGFPAAFLVAAAVQTLAVLSGLLIRRSGLPAR